jgi:hypothetical protein
LVKNESAATLKMTLPKVNISSVSSTTVVEKYRESSGSKYFEESTELEETSEELETFSEDELSVSEELSLATEELEVFFDDFTDDELDSSSTTALLSPSAEVELLASSPQAARKKITAA